MPSACLGIIGAVAPILERAEKEHLDAALSAFLGQAEHIRLVDALRIDALGLGDEAHGLDAVTEAGGTFEVKFSGGGLHLAGQFGLHRLTLAVEKILRLLDEFAIGPRRDIVHAGRGAALDLIEQAGPGAVGIDAV
jgi:hypothetical protein